MRATRRKWPIAIMVGSVTFVVTLLLFGPEGTLLCTPRMAIHQGQSKPSAGRFRSYVVSSSKISSDETFEAKKTKRYDKNKFRQDLDDSISNVTENLFIKFEQYENAPKYKKDTPTPTSQIVETVNRSDDILSNVSFSNLLSIAESDDFRASDFQNWTLTHMLLRFRYSFEIPHLVEKGDRVCDSLTEMIIIIPAVQHHGTQRELIRQTWASSIYGLHFPQVRPSSLRTKIAFIVGTRGLSNSQTDALRREASRYNDIVAADFVDSYRNLSLKMMVGLDWVCKFCSSAKYVMKADIDTFVNIPLLSKFLLEISKTVPRFILGYRHTWPKPPVMRTGKWQVDKEDYPFDTFPPYLFGHSYVITDKLVPLIVSTGKHVPLIPTEDAFITGILAYIIRAPRLHYEGFANVFQKVISCRVLYNLDMTVTKMSIHRFLLMWRDLLTKVCSEDELPSKRTSS